MLHMEHLTKDYGNGLRGYSISVWIVKRDRSSVWWEATEAVKQR